MDFIRETVTGCLKMIQLDGSGQFVLRLKQLAPLKLKCLQSNGRSIEEKQDERKKTMMEGRGGAGVPRELYNHSRLGM